MCTTNLKCFNGHQQQQKWHYIKKHSETLFLSFLDNETIKERMFRYVSKNLFIKQIE